MTADLDCAELYIGGPHPVRVVPESEDTATYWGGPHEVADTFILGQGYTPLSFDGERRTISREWAKSCE